MAINLFHNDRGGGMSKNLDRPLQIGCLLLFLLLFSLLSLQNLIKQLILFDFKARRKNIYESKTIQICSTKGQRISQANHLVLNSSSENKKIFYPSSLVCLVW